MSQTEWYHLRVEEVFEALGSSSNGLTRSEVESRLKKYGYNELKFRGVSPLVRFLRQFHNALIYVLLLAALVTGFLGHWIDTAVIIGVVIANTIIGFLQEGKAESSIEALKNMMVPECTVLRDGKRCTIQARELVPGDVVLLEGGDRVPADLRLFYAKNIAADEAALTGESVQVEKNVEPIPVSDLTPADQRCMVFSGTFITRGYGRGIVVATGEKTELGKIAEIMKETHEITTPLMRKINEFTRAIIVIILMIAAINFIVGVVFGFSFVYSFMASVSLAVAAIPEGLPAILTITLAFGVTAMAHKNALIKKLPAAEALGCTTVICSDKTGTLTRNQMTVVRVYCGRKDYHVSGVGYEPVGEFILEGKKIDPATEEKELIETLKAGYLCNNATLLKDETGYIVNGDPTEGALLVAARKAGLDETLPELDRIPFESEKQYMATLHQGEEENIIYVKGSPERILRMCQNQLIGGRTESLSSETVLAKAHELAGDALRVLGFACKTVSREIRTIRNDDLEGLTFLGLQGMIDPPREEAIEAVARCKQAGIRVVMMTGDHVQTAKAIAREIGIGTDTERVLTGEELSGMSDDELYEIVEEISVYARVAPEHKFRITTQLQKKGHIVAVTGDGVNDAPALKAADIGIAMGITGTEVSKEAADMVLADDNFASIVAAVEEGRYIFENIRKIILYTLPTNGGQALLIMGAIAMLPFIPLFALRLPLEPIHILWINLADAVFLALPLIREPTEKGLLERPPRDPDEKIADRLFFRKVGLVSLVMASAGFMVYYHYGSPALSDSMDELLLSQAQTAAFATVTMVHIFYLFTARSITESVFTFSPLSNRWVPIGVAVTLITLLMIIYIPVLQTIFRTAAFPAAWWIPIILLALSGLFVIEIEKFLMKRFFKHPEHTAQ